jgi:hypothetical protein
MIESPKSSDVEDRSKVLHFPPSLRTTMNVKCVKIKTIFFVFLANSSLAICGSGFYVEYASYLPIRSSTRAVLS